MASLAVNGLNYSLFVVRDRGLTVNYECNNVCLGERRSIIVGCYSVGLKLFSKVHNRKDGSYD